MENEGGGVEYLHRSTNRHGRNTEEIAEIEPYRGEDCKESSRVGTGIQEYHGEDGKQLCPISKTDVTEWNVKANSTNEWSKTTGVNGLAESYLIIIKSCWNHLYSWEKK